MVFLSHSNINSFDSIWSKLEDIDFNILVILAKLVTITRSKTGATYQACSGSPRRLNQERANLGMLSESSRPNATVYILNRTVSSIPVVYIADPV